MPFKKFLSDAHFYHFMGSCGSTIPVRAMKPPLHPEQSEQQQDPDEQDHVQPKDHQ